MWKCLIYKEETLFNVGTGLLQKQWCSCIIQGFATKRDKEAPRWGFLHLFLVLYPFIEMLVSSNTMNSLGLQRQPLIGVIRLWLNVWKIKQNNKLEDKKINYHHEFVDRFFWGPSLYFHYLLKKNNRWLIAIYLWKIWSYF